MSGLGRRRQKIDEDVDIDMVPVMNMFLVLIPFLLISANFIHLKVINTSVPVLAETEHTDAKKNDIKITAVVELEKDGIRVSATSDDVRSEDLKQWSVKINKKKEDEYPLAGIALYLKKIKKRYPASDTLIIVPDETVIYETIIQVMDSVRYMQNKVPLFPNVVLSGKIS